MRQHLEEQKQHLRESAGEAAAWLFAQGKCRSANGALQLIRTVLSGFNKSAYGYVWRYV